MGDHAIEAATPAARHRLTGVFALILAMSRQRSASQSSNLV
jgi:hypothetical protein